MKTLHKSHLVYGNKLMRLPGVFLNPRNSISQGTVLLLKNFGAPRCTDILWIMIAPLFSLQFSSNQPTIKIAIIQRVLIIASALI